MQPAQQLLPHGSAVAAPPMQQAPAPQETSINIAILDSKDFPEQIAPIQELYTEISMMDGKVLFECPGLLKQTGIDLMNCPLTVVLQMRVRRRMPQGPHVLWHVVLPLPLISKNLMAPPHEWETWIGLMPNKQVLTDHPADVMFTQAVHLISRPDFPKLRLRFTYRNPQLQAQAQQQLVQQEQENARRKQQTEQMGKAQFQDIFKLMETVRDNNGSNASSASAKAAAAMQNTAPAAMQEVTSQSRSKGPDPPGQDALRDTHPVAVIVPSPEQSSESSWQQMQTQQAGYADSLATAQMQPQQTPTQYTAPPQTVPSDPFSSAAPQTVPSDPFNSQWIGSQPPAREEHLREALGVTLQFIGNVRSAVASRLPAVDSTEVLAGSTAPGALDHHCQQLQQYLQAAITKAACKNSDAEPLLVEGVRMAIMGLLDDGGDSKVPATTVLTPESEHVSGIKEQFPQLWKAFGEVSALAKERAFHLEQRQQMQAAHEEQCRRMQEKCNKLTQELNVQASKENQAEGQSKTEASKFEKLLKQQREALQMNFDTETKKLRQQLEDMRAAAREKESEVSQLREHLSKFVQSRKG